ncbi:MAG: translation initiation factor IF-3 [Planctomycetota bacterium]
MREAPVAEKGPRMNESIRITPIRLVGPEGEMHGVVATPDAMKMAQDAGMDLVEVAADARPPVCKIMDYGKYKYQQSKKQAKNKSAQPELKEIRLRPKTGDHDIDFKIKRARGFLEHRDKVKVTILYRGRENAHHERGKDILQDVIDQLEDIAKVEKLPSMEGPRMMSTVLAPR